MVILNRPYFIHLHSPL